MLEIDRPLAFLARRLRFVPGIGRPIKWAQIAFARKYAAASDAWVEISDFDGSARFRVHRSSYLGSLIYWNGYHALDEIFLLDRLLSDPAMVFADIGASNGEFSVFAARRLARGIVLAFEPWLYDELRHNVTINGLEQVRTFPFGLFDAETTGSAFDSARRSPTFARNDGTTSVFPASWRKKVGEFPLRRLDDVIREEGILRLDAVKIDTEGSEQAVLRGGREVLSRFRPFLIIEIQDPLLRQAGGSARELIGLLRELGYDDCFRIVRSDWRHLTQHGLRGRYGRLSRIEWSEVEGSGQNFLCSPAERTEALAEFAAA